MNNTYLSYDEFKKESFYNVFISDNPDLGYLKIQVSTAGETIPIPDANVVIQKRIGDDKVLFYSGRTNKEGIIDNIILPAPKSVKVNNIDIPRYTMYELSVYHKGFKDIEQYDIGMFGGVKIIQYVKLTPEVVINV